MLTNPIDINCDMGESSGAKIIGQDEELMPFINSCNIACGYHGGDPFHIEKTIKLAIENNVRIGAHPSYPDAEGFGRRNMEIPKPELKAIIQYQVSALKGMVESQGGVLSYVKPHGALYNRASKDKLEAETIINAIQAIDTNLSLMGLAGSITERVALDMGIPFIAEAFCDRRYERNGTLMSRENSNAIITNVEDAVTQVRQLLFDKKVDVGKSEAIDIMANSICVHGDNPKALEIVKGISHMYKSI